MEGKKKEKKKTHKKDAVTHLWTLIFQWANLQKRIIAQSCDLLSAGVTAVARGSYYFLLTESNSSSAYLPFSLAFVKRC